MNKTNTGSETMNHETAPRASIAMITAVFACIVLVMAFGVGKLTGTLDPLVARRGVGAMSGLMLMVIGNFVPKLHLFQPAAGASYSNAIDRLAGWIFVICGFAFSAGFLLAPADKVFIVPPLIVLASFVAVLVRWLMLNEKQPGYLSLHLTPGRRILATMLATVLWMCAIFLCDAFWGDRVSRGMAMLFPIILIWFQAFRATEPDDART